MHILRRAVYGGEKGLSRMSCILILRFSDLYIKSLSHSCTCYKRVEREREELLENRRKNPDLYGGNSYWVMLRCPVLGLFSDRIH